MSDKQQPFKIEPVDDLRSLVSDITHEINNPNNYILLNAQFLSEVWRDIQPVLKEYSEKNGEFFLAGLPYSEAENDIPKLLTSVINGSLRIKTIVNYLRIFSGNYKNNYTQIIEVNELIEVAVVSVNKKTETNNIHFYRNDGQAIPKIKGSIQHFEQALQYLLTNIYNTICDPQQKIIISTDYNTNKKQLVIIIQNQGPRFEKSKISNLELSISSQIIKNHGGKLLFESKTDPVMTVSIILPVAID